jgi:DNA-binding NarL/FixJ family response regulator
MYPQLPTARPPIRVLIADAHPVARTGVRMALEASEEVAVVGEAASERALWRLVDELAPEVVVVDPYFDGGDGPAVVRALVQWEPHPAVLVVAASERAVPPVPVLQAGARGYLLKRCGPGELLRAVLRVHAGELVLDQTGLDALISHTSAGVRAGAVETLSERECEVLQLLADGATSKEIARTLGLAPKTVENHRCRILEKLSVANSAAAVRLALAQGLIVGLRPLTGVESACSGT